MSKAILVVDMPKNCEVCRLCDTYDTCGFYCVPADKYLDGENCTEERATFCPLIDIEGK